MKVNEGIIFIYNDCKTTCKNGEHVFVIRGNVTIKKQSGGFCWATDNATLNSTGQEGGNCWATDNATLNSTGQEGGFCGAFGDATLNSIE